MKRLKWINTIAFAVMILVNALANVIPIGGRTTGEVSQAYPNLFTPAPITFAIWGVIYLMLAGFILYQWGLFDHDGLNSEMLRGDVGLLFAISCLFNTAWILCWHLNAIGLSVLCIMALLVTLILIERRITPVEGNPFQKVMAKSGFDVYFGWIIAATIANISVWLTSIGWNGWGISAGIWTIAMLVIGAGIGVAVVIIGHNPLAGISMGWAYTGIVIRHVSASGYAGSHPLVIAAAVIGIVAILSAVAITTYERFCKCEAADPFCDFQTVRERVMPQYKK